MRKKILIFYCCFFAVALFKAQADSTVRANDSIAAERQNNKRTYSVARKAAIMSAIVPGLGQIYNRKYWKVPIVYGGLVGFGYMFVSNNQEYSFYRKNLRAIYDSDSSTVNTTKYTAQDLKDQRDFYLKNRNFGAIGFCLMYLLNIIDANVDGHLRTFDVSDDLSLRIEPWQQIHRTAYGYTGVTGVSLKFNFK